MIWISRTQLEEKTDFCKLSFSLYMSYIAQIHKTVSSPMNTAYTRDSFSYHSDTACHPNVNSWGWGRRILSSKQPMIQRESVPKQSTLVNSREGQQSPWHFASKAWGWDASMWVVRRQRRTNRRTRRQTRESHVQYPHPDLFQVFLVHSVALQSPWQPGHHCGLKSESNVQGIWLQGLSSDELRKEEERLNGGTHCQMRGVSGGRNGILKMITRGNCLNSCPSKWEGREGTARQN